MDDEKHRTPTVFNGIRLSTETVEDVTTLLSRGARDVGDNQPRTLDTAALGGSETGGQVLATHASSAQESIARELSALQSGLRGYRDTVRHWERNLESVDESSAATWKRFEATTDALKAPQIGAGQHRNEEGTR